MAIEKLFFQKPFGCNSFGRCFCAEMAIVAGKFDQASIMKLGEKMMAWFQIHTPSLASVSDIVEL